MTMRLDCTTLNWSSPAKYELHASHRDSRSGEAVGVLDFPCFRLIGAWSRGRLHPVSYHVCHTDLTAAVRTDLRLHHRRKGLVLCLLAYGRDGNIANHPGM